MRVTVPDTACKQHLARKTHNTLLINTCFYSFHFLSFPTFCLLIDIVASPNVELNYPIPATEAEA